MAGAAEIQSKGDGMSKKEKEERRQLLVKLADKIGYEYKQIADIDNTKEQK